MSFLKQFGHLSIQTRNIGSGKHLNPTKFTSILANVPFRPTSPWQMFAAEKLKGTKNEKMGQRMADISAEWKSLSEQDKKKYFDIYKEKKEAHDAAMEKALNNATSKQFYEENLLRKKYKLPLLKDPKKPKKPLNAYMLYFQAKKDDPSVYGLTIQEKTKKIAQQYAQLPESEKKSFTEKANKLHEEYRKKLAEYNRLVGGLDYGLTEGDIVCIFSQYGEIMHIILVRDRKTGKSKGYAFLQYEDQRSTILAVDNLNGATVLGRTIRVDHSYGPKKHKKEGEEDSEEEGPLMNVAPEYIEVDEAEEKKEKKKKKKKESKGDDEDPMAEYFRKKKKKKSKRRHSPSPSSDKHRSRSPSYRRRSRSPSYSRRRSRSPSYDRRRSRSPSYRRRSPSPSSDKHGSRSPSYRRRSRSPSYSRRRSRSPSYDRRRSRSPRRK
ncbi:hypothetical protein G6F70_007825 [Rhizopus microsporus]|nr:hypothetical protein G6F71_007779 [Rhizopus microsporus]KAG1195962.1 hypothetical protein G6F70_007825 [Rhizopus microsporus]KAG1208191.1 hypothetical protein G6F69_007432 [Rhizopus microsporus]